jgi:biotin carboxylase
LARMEATRSMSSASRPLTVLCLASYEKGQEFMRACKQLGCRVLLITMDTLVDVDWPRDSIDEIYYMTDMYDQQHMVNAVSYLAHTERIDRVVALDDFDVETAANLREHLRIPGMGATRSRYFRDKLAMRFQAQAAGLLVPPFVPVLNHDRLREYMETVPPPWVLKPRWEASAVGIKKLSDPADLWPILESLGDRQSYFLLEQFIPGDVYHVDCIVFDGEVPFAEVHKYASPPLDVVHAGGIFCTRTLPRGSEDEQALEALNRELVAGLGLVRGVTHTEFIKGEDGRFYFLEVGARVGGANIAEMVEAATGVNLWREWAAIEATGDNDPYAAPQHHEDYAGVIISLARQEYPDTSAFQDPEIVWRLNKRHHVGLIVRSRSWDRVQELLDQYMHRFDTDFAASLPPPDKPTS